MGKITTVGIDLAKNVFSVHAVDENGVVLVRKTVSVSTNPQQEARAEMI